MIEIDDGEILLFVTVIINYLIDNLMHLIEPNLMHLIECTLTYDQPY